MTSEPSEQEVHHKLNAYTWPADVPSAPTSEFLRCGDDWSEVTCERCLALRREPT